MQPSGPAEMILITDNVQEVIGSEELVPENAAILAACSRADWVACWRVVLPEA